MSRVYEKAVEDGLLPACPSMEEINKWYTEWEQKEYDKWNRTQKQNL